mmetsp:Transcript_5950/g.13436  ORF Transcript_5950/g.13436 Transcript_5950/m.13436 type:complete len:329 (-) Transcript_5950:495-1481(-)
MRLRRPREGGRPRRRRQRSGPRHPRPVERHPRRARGVGPRQRRRAAPGEGRGPPELPGRAERGPRVARPVPPRGAPVEPVPLLEGPAVEGAGGGVEEVPAVAVEGHRAAVAALDLDEEGAGRRSAVPAPAVLVASVLVVERDVHLDLLHRRESRRGHPVVEPAVHAHRLARRRDPPRDQVHRHSAPGRLPVPGRLPAPGRRAEDKPPRPPRVEGVVRRDRRHGRRVEPPRVLALVDERLGVRLVRVRRAHAASRRGASTALPGRVPAGREVRTDVVREGRGPAVRGGGGHGHPRKIVHVHRFFVSCLSQVPWSVAPTLRPELNWSAGQ